MYELEIPNPPRDKPPPPKIIALQSQLESLDHYFLHWSWPGPAVMCQVSKLVVSSMCGIHKEIANIIVVLLNTLLV